MCWITDRYVTFSERYPRLKHDGSNEPQVTDLPYINLGVDAAAHMSEEVNNASLTVPWMMFGTIILNGVLGFVMVITYVFVIQNLETQIVDSTSPYPFISVFEVAVGSKAGAIGMTVPVIILLAAACVNR